MPRVIASEYLSEYKLLVGFSDRSTFEIDFLQFLDGPIFEPLKDLNILKNSYWMDGQLVGPMERILHLKLYIALSLKTN